MRLFNIMIQRFYAFYRTSIIIGFWNRLYFKFALNKEINLIVYDKPFKIRSQSTDLGALIQLAEKEIKLMEYLIDKESEVIIVDLGAYIGSTSIAFSRLFPNAKIISVEPNHDNYRLLKFNTAAYPNIQTINGAISVSNGEAVLFDRKTGSMGYTVISEPQDTTKPLKMHTIKKYRLEDIVDVKKVAIVKIDIEGSEKELFQKSASLKKIPIVFVELHERIIAGCKNAFFEFSSDRIIIKDDGEKYLSIKHLS
jgi:FkbM family methyltransferase